MKRRPPAAEPLFNAPGPVLALAASLPALYLLQSRWPNQDAPIAVLGLVPQAVMAGQVWRLLTVMVVHGGWTHALLNAVGALAFGVPVFRWFSGRGRGGPGQGGPGQGGSGRGGAMPFLAFYVVCGLLSSLGYVLLHPSGGEVVVGASGAISGLMGASSRLIDRPGALAPFASRTVLGMAAGWSVINLLMATRLLAVGTDGAPVAWEAHLFGYAAGLLLIGPASYLARPRA